MSVIVIEFITLDGIVTDPDGSGGTPAGGWAFRHGPEAVAGDKFRLGSVLDEGVLLLGRKTWELFSRIWPDRDDPFSARMNAVPKLVATRTLTGTSAWVNSQAVEGDIIDAVKGQRRDVIITGSLSIVHTLMANDLIDEYRLLTFPTILGTGERLFPRWPARRPGARVGRAGRCRGLGAVPQGGMMTARFLALHEVPAGAAATRGAPYYLAAELERDTMEDLRAAFAASEGRTTAADGPTCRNDRFPHTSSMTTNARAAQGPASTAGGGCQCAVGQVGNGVHREFCKPGAGLRKGPTIRAELLSQPAGG